MTPRLDVERGGARRSRSAACAPRWRRAVPAGHLRLLGAASPESWLDLARRLLVSLSDSDLPPARRGPHPLLALASYTALIVVATLVMLVVTTLGRMLDRLL